MKKTSKKKPESTEGKEYPETGSYQPPISPVEIPKGDTGFALTKKNYKRFIWTWNEYIGKKPKFPKGYKPME
jgi:hypothetical protein